MLGRKADRLVAGRAFVVPASTGNVGGGEDGNVNNLAANARATSSTVLVARSAADGGPVDPASIRITANLSNWLRLVLYYAGNNTGPWRELPAELDVPVWIDAGSRRISSLDVGTAEIELAAYREVGRREWLETEAPLADVRGLVALPLTALRGLRGALTGLREIAHEIRHLGDTTSEHKPVPPEELEARRRTAAILRYQLERNPQQHAKLRASALQAGPEIARSTAGGAYPPAAFDAWIMSQETSGVISSAEAQQYCRDAGRDYRPLSGR
ncbi:hypothetical protein BH10ACT9_BH10ACT9_02140 [soil metagenome]